MLVINSSALLDVIIWFDCIFLYCCIICFADGTQRGTLSFLDNGFVDKMEHIVSLIIVINVLKLSDRLNEAHLS